MKLSRSRWLALAVFAVVAADWTTKFLVQNRLRLDSLHPVVDGWVWLAHRRNTGVAFSAMDGHEWWRVPLLAAASVVGICVAGFILAKSRDALVRLASGLVIAGAVGNLGDRLMNGAVTDFILVRFFPFVFNVADVAITVGAVLLAAAMILEERRQGGAGSSPSEELTA